jgi:hypothetical protein
MERLFAHSDSLIVPSPGLSGNRKLENSNGRLRRLSGLYPLAGREIAAEEIVGSTVSWTRWVWVAQSPVRANYRMQRH